MKDKRLKPRNPLVAVALFKKAGWTEKSSKAKRRDDKISLRKESKSKDFFQTAPSIGSSLKKVSASLAQRIRASAYEAGGWGFESLRWHQEFASVAQ